MVFGGEPPVHERPTDEQLCALLSVLASGLAPFVDFAVFGPFVAEEARMRKYSDQVFIEGRLQTRLIHGPSTHVSWRACWGVYKTAMIMADAVSLSLFTEPVRRRHSTYGPASR